MADHSREPAPHRRPAIREARHREARDRRRRRDAGGKGSVLGFASLPAVVALWRRRRHFLMKPLRAWKWGVLPVYNGFTHVERVRGWQLIMWRIDNGWAERGATCCISGVTKMLRLHSEDYYHWMPFTLTHSIHMALHQRFQRPEIWRRIVKQYAVTGDEWFARLSLIPIDLAADLRTKYGSQIADVFARAPVPEGVTIPHEQIYVDPTDVPN